MHRNDERRPADRHIFRRFAYSCALRCHAVPIHRDLSPSTARRRRANRTRIFASTGPYPPNTRLINMTDQDEEMPDAAAEVTAESLGKLDGPRRFANNGKKKLCAVPNCPKLSDGKRSNFMCRSHYTTTSLYRSEVEEERKAREAAVAAILDDGSDGDGIVGGGGDEDDEEGGGGGGGRRSRRNRKPSAKILRSVETEQVMKKELQRRREEKLGKGGGGSKSTGGGNGNGRASSRAMRIDYSALAGVNDDSSYASVLSYKKARFDDNGDDDCEDGASSIAGSSLAVESARPSIPKTRHIIRVAAYSSSPKTADPPLGPEPSYLFREGPLPPPSPPTEPQMDPPAFPFRRPIAVNPQEHSLADTGIYANKIRRRVQAEADSSTILPLPPRTVGGVRDQVEKTKQCNCKKSGCLKLYCDCFANAIQCTDMCSCVKCNNNESGIVSILERSKVIVSALERNPNAFRPKQAGSAGTATNNTAGAGSFDVVTKKKTPAETKGCNCKKSQCLKKYCECFNATLYCNPKTCNCRDCHNFKGNENREKVMQSRLKRAEKDAKVAASQAIKASKAGEMPKGLMGDPVAAAAVAAEAAASGVDVFMPPSAYAVPMKVGRDGTEMPGLSFGTAGAKKKSRNSATAQKRAYDTVEGNKRKPQYPAEDLLRMETEYERDARFATIELGSRLDTIYGLLEREKKCSEDEDNRVARQSAVPSVISTEYMGLEGKRAKESIEFVKSGVNRIKEATDRAQERARKLIDEKQSAGAAGPPSESGTEDIAMADVEDSGLGDLFCGETMPPASSEPALEGGKKATSAEEELFVLATQDAALLRELARIVREKALEMGADRIRQAASAAGRCHSAAEVIVKGGGD